MDGSRALTPVQRQQVVEQCDTLPTGKPARRVWIPQPGTTELRPLSIPTLYDRAPQAWIKQVVEPEWEAKVAPNSYGFRPGRSAHQAVAQAQRYVAEGYSYVVDLDLEKFFDRVNHDKLMARVAARVSDKRVLKFIRACLEAGVMEDGLVRPVDEGTPQGGPLTPPTIWQNCRSSPALSLRARPFGHDTVTDSPARR